MSSSHPSPPPDDVPRGLVCSALSDNRGRARRRIALSVVVCLAALALTKPGYTWMSGIEPYIFGLPLSLIWVVAWLAIVFVALLLLYMQEEG